MPTWIHPFLRALQEDEETVGIIPKTSAPLIVKALADEAAGVTVRPVLQISRVLVGTVFKH